MASSHDSSALRDRNRLLQVVHRLPGKAVCGNVDQNPRAPIGVDRSDLHRLASIVQVRTSTNNLYVFLRRPAGSNDMILGAGRDAEIMIGNQLGEYLLVRPLLREDQADCRSIRLAFSRGL